MSLARLSRDDGKPLIAFGYELDALGRPIREFVPASKAGVDYGADPVGDGTHRMVPSGDIVTLEERIRRLSKRA